MDDNELISRVRAGDSEAYAPLVRRYQADIVRFCWSMLGNTSESEDAAQDVFVKAYHSIKKFRGDASFLTWLYRIASNHCLDLLRSRSRRKTESWDALVEEKGEQIEALITIPDESLNIENQDLARRVLATLPDDYRNVLILREMQELSYEEIARVLNCSLDSVKARLSRARQDFAEKLRHFLRSADV